jgi:hypothetical protein
MKVSQFLRFSLFAALALTFVACEDDDDDDTPPAVVNEEELITDLILTFTDADTQQSFEFSFSDDDGEGGDDPIIDDIVLPDSASYTLSIEVKDESNPNDVEDITEEIEEEDDEHQFFFEPFNGAENSVAVSYSDMDGDGNPLGLLSQWIVTQPTSSGNEKVRITLRHEPNKNGSGVADGDITNAGGETDIAVEFNITVTD